MVWIRAVGLTNFFLEQLRVKWQADDWQKVSTMNKKNRQSQDGHNLHSGGSISTREHAKRMVSNS